MTLFNLKIKPVKKIFFLSLIVILLIGCKKDDKKANENSGSKTDTSAVSTTDTASVDVDSTAPIKAISTIEGLPAGTKIVYVNLDTLQEKYQYFADENKANTARLKQLETQIVSKEKAIMATQSALQNRFQELQAKSQTMSPKRNESG